MPSKGSEQYDLISALILLWRELPSAWRQPLSHRAAIYRVKVRPYQKRESWRLLGDYDESGTWLGDTISTALNRLEESNKENTLTARFEASLPSLGSEQVGATFLSGRSGITSVISRQGKHLIDRQPSDSEEMRTAVLFALPRRKDAGRLIVHVPEGRSIKTLVQNAVKRELSAAQYVIEMNPIVPADALLAAIERDAIESVTYVKLQPALDDKFKAAADWGEEEVDRLELSLRSKRNMRLRGHRLRRFLEMSSQETRKTIFEFQDLAFDEVRVEVEMPDGTRRSFYVGAQSGGHPLTQGIAVSEAETDSHGAKADVLSRELGKVAKSVTEG
jgi:hypothetical protein